MVNKLDSNNRTLYFKNVCFSDGYSIAGPKEGMGKLKDTYDLVAENDMFNQKTFEQAERKMFELALDGLLTKANLTPDKIDMVIGGDLLNQIISASFAMRKYHSGFIGLYNACGTYVESLMVGSILVDNYVDCCVCGSGSHFSTAERQYRYPLELGVLRSPVTQWTATGAGCTLLKHEKTDDRPQIVSATVGRVVDFGIKDVNNMGAAMAPAAMDTFLTYFENTKKKPSEFDLILTGDLGKLGKEILIDLMGRQGYDFTKNYADCGASLYYDDQKTYMGGSGAACSSLYANGQMINSFIEKKLKSVLLVGTGALMSPTTAFQGESIPAIAHCVEITMGVKE